MYSHELKIASVNCNGLGQKPKRIKVFKWLKQKYKGILFLQETYSSTKCEYEWKRDIGHQYKAYYSHGETNSKGVCTIIPKCLTKFITKSLKDKEGRMIAIQLTLDQKNYVLVNVYLPPQDRVPEQIKFLENLELTCAQFENATFIIGGDHNILQNPKLDKYNSKNEEPSKVAKILENLKSRMNLSDVWRIQNPTLRRYTWRRHKPLQQSRLDYWLVTNTLIGKTVECNIGISFLSDHNLININLNITKVARVGKGLWKLNNSLLQDQEYVTQIETCIDKHVTDLQAIGDKRLAWEYLKMVVRRESISYSIARAKRRKAEEVNLLNHLRDCEARLEDPTVVDQ